MNTAEALAWTAVGLAGLAGSFLCSGMETGFYALNRVRLDVRAARTPPDPQARFLKQCVERPDQIITTILIGNNAFAYLVALAAASLMAASGSHGPGAILIDILILTPIMLVVGEAFPKELFRVETDRLTYRFAWFLRALRYLFTVVGILPLVLAIARAVANLAAAKAGATAERSALPAEPRLRIEALLKEGAAQGTLSASQTTLIERALAMRGATVADEMVPWTRVRALPLDAAPAAIAAALARNTHASYPVIDRRGRVVGIYWAPLSLLQPPSQLGELLREPARLAPTVPVLDAIALVRASPARLGIVERHGKPLGMVTEKDLVEPLTGNI